MPESEVVLARELTKRFEEILRGNPENLLNQIENRNLKGEIIAILYPGKAPTFQN